MENYASFLSAEVGAAFFGGFAKLRPVQEAAIASLGAGRSAVISAGTGSGKTEAVTAPLISRFRAEAIRDAKTVLLYVCPTKALINDLSRRLTPPLQRLGLRLSVRHGDKNQLGTQQPDHVVLTTPESFAILLTEKHPVLEGVRAVVLDEVHLLYNNQRGLMVAILLHRLRRNLGHDLQVAAISATVGDLGDIRSFLLGSEADADLLPFGGSRTLDGDVSVPESLAGVRELVEKLMKPGRRKLLIFANSRRETEELAGELKTCPTLERLVVTHHSSMSPDAREGVEHWFSSADQGVCVSTSTLEMGIDIGDIDAVMLYGPPTSIESLLQRIGRGNRRAHKTNAICISRDRHGSVRESALFSAMLGLAAEGRIPDQAPFELFGAVAQQCLISLLQHQGAFTMIRDILDQVAYRPDLTRELIESILAELSSHGLIQRHDYKNRYGAADGLWDLCDKNIQWGNFPLGSQTIDLVKGGRIIGSIPRANLMRLGRGSVFRFGGSRYRVSALVENQLRVETATGKGGEVSLIYGSQGKGGVSSFVANALWSWIFGISESTAFMQKAEWNRVAPVLEPIRANLCLTDLPFAEEGGKIRYYTFGGETLNRVLLSFFGLPGESCGLSILLPAEVDWSRVPTTCEALSNAAAQSFASSNQQTIFQQFLPVDLQRREWMEAWLNDRDAQKALERLARSRNQLVPVSIFSPFLN
jgi:ATP-dependent Lhr-like helicase